MKIELINKHLNLSEQFVVLAKTDRECPECGKKGLIIKYRCNGKIGGFHQTSGILLACEDLLDCTSWWNKETPAESYPWHTWLTSCHKSLDERRGGVGNRFLDELRQYHPELFKMILKVDKAIISRCEQYV